MFGFPSKFCVEYIIALRSNSLHPIYDGCSQITACRRIPPVGVRQYDHTRLHGPYFTTWWQFRYQSVIWIAFMLCYVLVGMCCQVRCCALVLRHFSNVMIGLFPLSAIKRNILSLPWFLLEWYHSLQLRELSSQVFNVSKVAIVNFILLMLVVMRCSFVAQPWYIPCLARPYFANNLRW